MPRRFSFPLLVETSFTRMADDGDGGFQSSLGSISPLPPIPTLSDLIANSQPKLSPSASYQELPPPNLDTLHISTTPFSPSGSSNASPLTPVTPGHDHKPSKRPNPLIDLIDTEKNYVDLLGGIIRVSLFANQFVTRLFNLHRKSPLHGPRTTFHQKS